MVRKGIASLADFPGRVGIMGGEPTLHPKFHEILAVVREMIPDKRRRELWTSGFKWEEFKDDKLLPCLKCSDKKIEECSQDLEMNCKPFKLYCGIQYSEKKCGPLYRSTNYVTERGV